MDALGPVLMLVSIPLIFRWVPPNRLYGFRIAATLRNESVWYDANALSGRHMFALGVVLVALDFALPASMRDAILWAVAGAGFAVILFFDWRTANRWARDAGRSPQAPSQMP